MAQCRVELCHHTIVLTYALCETHMHWFTPQNFNHLTLTPREGSMGQQYKFYP
jgi:hypothetical protein